LKTFRLSYLALIVALYASHGSLHAADKIPTPKAHPCVCGCDLTGSCVCPSCNVGCGFAIPTPKPTAVKLQAHPSYSYADGSIVAQNKHQYLVTWVGREPVFVAAYLSWVDAKIDHLQGYTKGSIVISKWVEAQHVWVCTISEPHDVPHKILNDAFATNTPVQSSAPVSLPVAQSFAPVPSYPVAAPTIQPVYYPPPQTFQFAPAQSYRGFQTFRGTMGGCANGQCGR